MIEEIKTAFELTRERYIKVLTQYRTKPIDTGFTESNLTNNFVICLEKTIGESAVSWFEATISNKPLKHIDAVVFDIENKISYTIESKRIFNAKLKVQEIKNDIKRLKNPDYYNFLETGLNKINIDKRYGIVLADIWLNAGKQKKDIYESWPNSICEPDKCLWANKLEMDNYVLLIAVIEI